jgi:hypothetical protein
MTKAKPGFVRIGCDIPEDLHRRIKEYNKKSVNTLNMSKVMVQAIEAEVAKIKATEETIEATPLVDEKGISIICADGKPYTIKDLMMLNDAEIGLHNMSTAREAMVNVEAELKKLRDSGNVNILRMLHEGPKASGFGNVVIDYCIRSTPENPIDIPEMIKELVELMRKTTNVFMYFGAYNRIHYTKFPN